MNKLLILTVLAVAFAGFRASAGMSVGVQGGVNFASTSYDPDLGVGVNNTTKAGFAGGATLEYGVMDWLYVQPELMYITRGSKQTYSVIGISGEATTTSSYIDLPILAKGKWDVGGVMPFALAGPVIGYRLSAKQKTTLGSINSGDVDVKSSTEAFNVGLSFGGGVEIPIDKSIGVTVGARYNLGLTNVSKSASAGVTNTQKTKLRDILVLAGVTFAL